MECFKDLCRCGYEVRLLKPEEVRKKYLPLRFDVLHREFGYDHGTINNPRDFYDTFDETSLSIGIFLEYELIAAARLVRSRNSKDLPSSIFLQNYLTGLVHAESCAEISRAVVCKKFRGKGLFRVLFFSTICIACQEDIPFVIISEMKNVRFKGFLEAYRFREIKSDYWFSDEKIAPTVKTASYIGRITEGTAYYRRMAGNALFSAIKSL